jgi:glycosyltransferase involved in cell wall biosynthesis
MILHIDGRFYAQPTTGVQRYGQQLLAVLDALVAQGGPPPPIERIVLHTPSPAHWTIPTFHAIGIRSYGIWHGHAWEQLELPRHARGGVLFCPGNVAPVASLVGPTPVVVTVHSLAFKHCAAAYSRRFRVWYNCITPLVMRRAARVVTVSESERVNIIRTYPAASDRVVAIQNGSTPVNPARAFGPAPARAPYILYVGSLSAGKNYSGMMAAFAELAGKRPDLRLVVAGGTAAAFAPVNSILDPAIRDRVVFLGQVDDDVLADAYHHATCLAFPSLYEASPLPPTEAMAHGCPVVAADIPALRERCGDAALYCDSREPASIAPAIARILDDSALADHLRAAGARRAASFTWQACGESTLRVLRDVAMQHDMRTR